MPSASTEDICSICLDEFVVGCVNIRKARYCAKDNASICSTNTASSDGSRRTTTVPTAEDLSDNIIIFN